MRNRLATPAVIRPEHAHAFNVQQTIFEGRGDDGTEVDAWEAQNRALARRIWEVLQLHYPGHQWVVAASHEQGGAFIDFPMFTTWRYFIRLVDLKGDPGMKAVVRAGGEILERYRLPRSGFSVADLVAAHERFRPAITARWAPPE